MRERIQLIIIGLLVVALITQKACKNNHVCPPCPEIVSIDTIKKIIHDTIQGKQLPAIVKWKDSIVYTDTGNTIVDYKHFVIVPRMFLDSLIKDFFSERYYSTSFIGNNWKATLRDTISNNLKKGARLEVETEKETIVKIVQIPTTKKAMLFIGGQSSINNSFYFGPKVSYLNKSNTALYSGSYQVSPTNKSDLYSISASINLFPKNKN